jgi:hypothetical protein
VREAVTVAFRLASWGRPLRTEASRVPGRFHRPAEEEPTQYLCLHPLGPWAEFLRGNDLRAPEQARVVSQRVWALRLDLAGLVKVGFEDAARHRARPGDLVSDDYRACHRLARRLRQDGARGMVVPSAALPGTLNVVLFGARVSAPYLVDPLGALDVPAAITADGGRPPEGLLRLVRFRGDSHAALEAHRAGRPFRHQEPAW